MYLQRLANPNLPWDANANPYIIVDQMWVDLTCYNGEKYVSPTGPEFQGMLAPLLSSSTAGSAAPT